MTTCDLEMATRGQVNARRNYLMGLWAGRKLGIGDKDLPHYVHEVMLSDFQEPGPGDVVRKVSRDLAAVDGKISEEEVLRQLTMMEKSVRSELLATD
ncbi:MAG: ATPase inhibitor subunit zeta [Pseudomonadota bacterium]